jgi:peptidoglycan/LPS O-acetylase OafA/YrhL
MSESPPFAYRPDIDGLRAVAVLAVLFFHGFPGSLPGGFVGVDVFFVISGFLISGIIFDALDSGSFSFVEFYSRRIRRIFPALALVCLACLAFGWISLLPGEFVHLGKHVIGGSAFISNFVLLFESGYFDFEAARKPLLHLWSLGVEEQYYLVWPALLFLLRRHQRATLLMLVALGVGSFALNLYFTRMNTPIAFYVPFTRFWELMVGSALAHQGRYSARGARLLPKNWSTAGFSERSRMHLANLRAILGLCAVALSLVLIDEKRSFPGWWALLVCIGAALVISAGPDAWFNKRFLGSRPFVWIGLISYPLYLWHWPLLSYAKIVSSDPPFSYRVVALLASIALAWLTYTLVELPLRRRKSRPELRRVTLQLASAMALVGAIGGLAWFAVIRPASARDPRIVAISEAMSDWDAPRNRVYPGTVASTVLFFGDSHMEQYWPRIKMLLEQPGAMRNTVDFRTAGGCAPIPGVERKGEHCLKFVNAGFARALDPEVSVIVIAASWGGFATRRDYYRPDQVAAAPLDLLAPETQWVYDNFANSLAGLRKAGKRVVVLLSTPRGSAFDPNSMVDRSTFPPRAKPLVPSVRLADQRKYLFPIDSRIRKAVETAGAQILDPKDWLCSDTDCPTVDSAGRPLYKDISHLRASATRARAKFFDQFVLTKQSFGTH